MGQAMTLAEIIEQLKRVADVEPSNGQWIGNIRRQAVRELEWMGLIRRTGPGNGCLRLTQMGKDLLALADRADGTEIAGPRGTG